MQPRPELLDALAMAAKLATEGHYESRSVLFRTVNEALKLDWTDAAWRGHMNRNPESRDKLDSLLGAVRVIQRADERGGTERRCARQCIE
jgi:hypothetical protein